MNLVGSIEQMTLGFEDRSKNRNGGVRYIRFHSPFTIGFSKLIVRGGEGVNSNINISNGKKITVNSLAMGSLVNVLDEDINDNSMFATCGELDVATSGSGTGLIPDADVGQLGVAYSKADARREYSSYGDSVVEIDLGNEYNIESIEIIRPDWRMLFATLETCDSGAFVTTSTQTLHHLTSVGMVKIDHTGAFNRIPIRMRHEFFDKIHIPYQSVANRDNGVNLIFGQKFKRRLLSAVDWKNVNVGSKYH